ncbi:hypothetical protein SSBG_05659 [Streptomyces sp. SPB074]|nr:hypothetical protein SSBG_05659 [Streptomyces sp. SPB074]
MSRRQRNAPVITHPRDHEPPAGVRCSKKGPLLSPSTHPA